MGEDQHDDKQRGWWVEPTTRTALTTGGALLGRAIGGPGGEVYGAGAAAALPEFGWALIKPFDERWTQHRRARALDAVNEVAAVLGGTVEDVLTTGSATPARERLTGHVLNAAANTVMQGKIRALGRTLAHALADGGDDRVDEAEFVVAALADLEVPHARVLDTMARPAIFSYPPTDEAGWDQVRTALRQWQWSILKRDLPQYGSTLEAVLGTLERRGLIVELPSDDVAQLRKDLDERDRNARSRTSVTQLPLTMHGAAADRRWQVTALAYVVLRLLYEAGEESLNR